MTPPLALALEYCFALGQGDEARDLVKVGHHAVIARSQGRAFPSPFDELSPEVATEVVDRWGEPCEAVFEFLAQHYPAELLKLLASRRLRPTDLTFAAEIAGQLTDSTEVRRILHPLLTHADALVREGAIYGLARHIDPALRQDLTRLTSSDPSPAVRQAAADTLDDL